MNVSKIFISNRTKQKAEDLKLKFYNLEVLDWGDIIDFDVIINATSLGLNKESINLDFSKVANNKLFYDVIYNPEETNFLKEGKKLGNRTENGKLMFVYQAFEAFKLWHGIEPQINSETLEILKND
jgi:shikimate dehydrogenase